MTRNWGNREISHGLIWLLSHGVFDSLFHSTKGSSRNATVYTDPFSYMKAKGVKSFQGSGRQNDIVLMGLNERGLDLFLAKNPHVTSLDFAAPENSKHRDEIFSFVNKVKRKYESHSISVDTISLDRLSKGHSRGLELGF